jgi:hypothetical protein
MGISVGSEESEIDTSINGMIFEEVGKELLMRPTSSTKETLPFTPEKPPRELRSQIQFCAAAFDELI